VITCWRVFPWNPRAAGNEPFSAAFVPGDQGYGRFDLPGETSGVRYLAETPEHAVAEKLVRLRNQSLEAEDLDEFGFRLALVGVELDIPATLGLFDLCSASQLESLGIDPDRTAFRDRSVTQAISQQVFDTGYAGLRWWSAFFGEWHTLVVYIRRMPDAAVRFGRPEALRPEHPAVREAADALGITVTV
jgi:hypothetical protein